MEFAGAAFPITPLLSTCTKIVAILHNVNKKFKRAPLMMTSIATECNLIHVALAQLQNFDWGAVSTYGDGRQEQITRATESIILGCTLTLSVIEEYAIELQEYVEGAPISPTEQMGIMARVRVLWKEDEMRELLLQLRGYQTGLTSLIRAAHDSDFSDAQDTLNIHGANFGSLLNRSRSSRMRKPLSIRAAMAQAQTYSNIPSRPTGSHFAHPVSPNHSAHASTSTTQSLHSNVPSSGANAPTSSSARNSAVLSMSPITADLYDGATQATASKKPFSDSAKRNRPAFLALPQEQSDTIIEGRTLRAKRDKDQMRKSSPTVGEQFTFVPGQPPPEGAPPHPKMSQMALNPDEPSEQEFLVTEHLNPPPSGPLPTPPSRSPSRSRSPPNTNAKPPLRTSSRNELSRATFAEHNSPARSPPKQPSKLAEKLDQSITELEQGNRKSRTPSPQQEVGLSEEQELEERILQEQVLPPPPNIDSPQPSPHPRKQKSSSSVRSQIINLPETARLRKQASAEGILRKQSSAETMAVRRADHAVPALPIPMGGHIAMSGRVRGNAFGKQGSRSSLQSGMRAPPPRTSSLEGLSERNRKRSATDLSPSASHEAVPLPIRPRRSISRSASDAQRPSNLRMRRQPSRERESRERTHYQANHAPTHAQAPLQPSSAQSDHWPLTPEPGQIRPEPSHVPERTYPRAMSVEYKDNQEQIHSRNVSNSSFSNTKLLSPDHTPRASRSTTPHNGTPRSSSRNNTLSVIQSEAVFDREFHDDSISTAGSVAPSVMSAQWYRAPRERLGLGTRVSRSDVLPWELGAPGEKGPPVPPKPKTPPKSKMFPMFPSRAPSRLKESEDEQHPKSPPRSPLLTDNFLVNVKDNLPESPGRNERGDLHDRPGTSMKSREGASTPDWAARKKQKKEKKEKPKKEGRFPTVGEMVREYKGMTNTWYTSAYAEEADRQKAEREGQRPATGTSRTSESSGSKRNGGPSLDTQAPISLSGKGRSTPSIPRPSADMAGSEVSSTSSTTKESERQRKKKSNAFPSVKEMWGEYKTISNTWYAGHYQEEVQRDADTPQPHFS